MTPVLIDAVIGGDTTGKPFSFRQSRAVAFGMREHACQSLRALCPFLRVQFQAASRAASSFRFICVGSTPLNLPILTAGPLHFLDRVKRAQFRLRASSQLALKSFVAGISLGQQASRQSRSRDAFRNQRG